MTFSSTIVPCKTGPVITNPNYWDCNCPDDKLYIHSRRVPKCEECDTPYSEDQPDAREIEIWDRLGLYQHIENRVMVEVRLATGERTIVSPDGKVTEKMETVDLVILQNYYRKDPGYMWNPIGPPETFLRNENLQTLDDIKEAVRLRLDGR